MKSRKVLDICLDGFHIVCIRISDRMNPFRIYKVWAGHRRQLGKYADFPSVIWFIWDMYVSGADTFDTGSLIEWAKERHGH
jgi:hypothetical protein